jgi:putative membrane protein
MLTTLTSFMADDRVVYSRDQWGPHPWFALVWVAVIAAVVLFVWTRRRHWPRRSGESVLAERFARGEIDAAEYDARLKVLRERR